MKTIAPLFLILLLAPFATFSQVKNIKTDFGAVGDGVTDDHAAFAAAAAYINLMGGNVELLIPSGTYIVGNQNYTRTAAGLYTADDVLSLNGCVNVKITGVPKVGNKYPVIMMKPGLKFGTFDTSTLAPPANLNDYNPFGTSCVYNPTLASAYAYNIARIGTFFSFTNCNGITVDKIKIDGNINNLQLGGNYGCGSRPIELAAFGIFIDDSKNVTVKNTVITDVGLDGICIKNMSTTLKTKNINISSVDILTSGRNGISWIGGDSVMIRGTHSKYNGTGLVKTLPGAGFDLEPDFGTYPTNTNGNFINCSFEDNYANAVVTASTSSYNMVFDSCTMVGSQYYSLWWESNKTLFKNCKFFGEANCRGGSTSAADRVKFLNCTFTDCRLGTEMFGTKLLNIEFGGNYTWLDSCKLSNYYKPSFYIKPNVPDCSVATNQPLVSNSEFTSNVSTTVAYICAAWDTKWQNNRFTYMSGAPFYIGTGCGLGLYGNIDLGSGMVSTPQFTPQDCSALSRKPVDEKPGFVSAANNSLSQAVIFPNPVKNRLQLNYKIINGSELKISIYTSNGQLVLTKQLKGYQNTIDVSGLMNGTYHLYIQSPGKVITETFYKR
ncbi:right-handed parallel beta-helix repeat-containing protein [Ferruginibacter sp. HRS2-29]|uniref:right-handed parallel beta-helix repeat-containing protein n=1 Tax=Ferruginibacter sp. HRS2-29 TaxID=2487334 RepID=UPI0020CBE90D|nr:right-handed parallel beta-helix repeat-containing protein [Ferruginibacter sp. HRS2-29]MCP9750492.1 T9SS C-terminal target domain-containing protein [Ferruginibacter sp. HRS2-29]